MRRTNMGRANTGRHEAAAPVGVPLAALQHLQMGDAEQHCRLA